MKKLIAITVMLIGAITARSQPSENEILITTENAMVDITSVVLHKANSKHVNFFVFTKEKSKKTDWIAIYTLTRARIKSFFYKNKFIVINAKSAEDAAIKIENKLKSKNKLIKNIWFDSHGHYGNRYSSFRIGTDQFSYKNIKDSISIKHLEIISAYCDDKTKVGIGSCYGGADFYFPATDSTPASRMNGDSLMVGLGNIFKKSSIYASESWVMSKPGIFKNKFGFAGYPLNKRFKDSVYAPVWERMGKWRQYSYKERELKNIATVALDRKGNINIRQRNYNDFKKAKIKSAKALKHLKPGLATFS